MDTLYVFLIPCDNYQYTFACIVLWNVFNLSQNCISTQSLSFYWYFSLLMRTRVHMLNKISASLFIHMNITITCLLFIFKRAPRLLLALNIISTQSLFMFIRLLFAHNCYVDAFQFSRLISFIDVSNFSRWRVQ